MSDLDKLDAIRKNLEKAKEKKSSLTGKREALMESLKVLGYDSVEDAHDALEAMADKINKMDEDLGVMLDEFKKDYPDLV